MFYGQSHLVAILGFVAMAAANPVPAAVVVGGFDATRGGFESLAPGEDSALASDIVSAYPGTTFSFTDTLTPSFFSGINVVILGVATTDFNAITPLSSSEQGALSNFVLNGGTALIFTDNSTFSSNALTANASLLTPFGLSATGTLEGSVTAPILNPSGTPSPALLHLSPILPPVSRVISTVPGQGRF